MTYLSRVFRDVDSAERFQSKLYNEYNVVNVIKMTDYPNGKVKVLFEFGNVLVFQGS